jgi:type VI secretion system protein ImpC
MSERISRASVNLDIDTGTQAVPGTPEPDTPFRILILGDFSGRANRGVKEPLVGRRPRPVDNDNIEDLMTDLVVSLQLPHVRLRFRELDDFHPDHIYAKTELFQRLEDARTDPPLLTAPAPERAAARPAAVGGANLLDSMIEETEETSASQVMEEPDAFVAFLNKIMKPHLEARPDARVVKWSAKIDAIAGEQMRELLHHPDFQALEAAWRAVWMLVQKLDPDQELKILIFDTTLDELLADAGSVRKCLDTKDGWGAIVGNFNFGQEPADAARLQFFGKLASLLGGPFLAEGQPPAEEEPPAHWLALAKSAEAPWIGLAMPRFLLRLPYGAGTAPTEQFPFEEMTESVHAHYLWGNPAFACAMLLGQSFRRDGWNLHPGSHRRVEGLPLHVYKEDGASVAKPCAEILLREKDAEFLLENGLMPLASLKDEDAALLVRFQSIAIPPTALAGRWEN